MDSNSGFLVLEETTFPKHCAPSCPFVRYQTIISSSKENMSQLFHDQPSAIEQFRNRQQDHLQS